MKTLRLFFLVVLLGVSAYFSYQTYLQEQEKQQLKNDFIELSDVKYGLFNVDEWTGLFADVISKKVGSVQIDIENEDVLKNQISSFLTSTLSDFEKRYFEDKQGSFTGFFQSSIASLTGTFDQIKKDIPVFTDQIYTFLTKDGNKVFIQSYLKNQLNSYTGNTFTTTDYSAYNKIIDSYNQNDKATTLTYLQDKIEQLNSKNYNNQIILLGCFLLIILSIISFTNKTNTEFLVFTIYSLLCLSMGIFLPMIEIDARISEMNFTFLDQSIVFKDQVLFYRSKSIMEVVELLIAQERMDLLLVGVLVFLFSILFPLSKSISSIFYLFNQKLRKSKIIQFFVFQTGKWSMADVFVLALFMAYLGFDGIISDQLNQMNALGSNLLTTNASSLLFGFYAFTAFVLVSLFISQKIKKTNQSID